MHFKRYHLIFLLILSFSAFQLKAQSLNEEKPNVILIYADDLGYGDISCYGATKIMTPHIDQLAKGGILFTNGHASAATCTPSRYSILTGKYAWRKKGTGIAPGNAPLIIDSNRTTLADIFQRAGYHTAAIGKWHLGMGGKCGPDWNGDIRPGPDELGFDYSFLIPATPDRVPCVFVENHHVANLDPNDPIQVNYQHPVGDLPTGKDHPEMLSMKPSHGHDQTIINGISRIGYMSGGRSAWWVDDQIADVMMGKVTHFIETNKAHPFFLYFASHDIHVPRVPGPRFAGKSGMGPRGDEILELDWEVGTIMNMLDSLHLRNNTLIVFTSDNGPVLDDGYQDSAVMKLNGHKPAGPLRGGKYSIYDAGTRVPFIISWPGKINGSKISDALVSQVDLLASFASLMGEKLKMDDAPDSFDMLDVLLGKTTKGRKNLVEEARTLSLVEGDWKYIAPHKGPRINREVNIELGNDLQPQLYNLKTDIGETKNVAVLHPELVKQLAGELEKIEQQERSRP